jgi:hypothetical protein
MNPQDRFLLVSLALLLYRAASRRAQVRASPERLAPSVLTGLHLQPRLPFAALVVCAPGAGLVATAPPGPGQHEPGLDRCGPHQRHQQAADLGHGQRQQAEPAAQAAAAPLARSALVARARVTARNAWASNARVTWRYQPGHLRTS